MNKPDKWVVLKIQHDNEIIYKLYATRLGGYLDGDAWQINSGICKIEIQNNIINFHGVSGSIYSCVLNTYGTSMYTQSILDNIIEKVKQIDSVIEILPENTDWLKLNL